MAAVIVSRTCSACARACLFKAVRRGLIIINLCIVYAAIILRTTPPPLEEGMVNI